MKELVLVPRLIYTSILVFMGESVVFDFSNLTFSGFLEISILVVVFSLVFQYHGLRFMTKNTDVRTRRIIILVYLAVSFAVATFGAYLLSEIDWNQFLYDKDSFLRDFGLRMSIYIVAVSAFVAGVCERRALAMHGKL